MLLGLAAWKWFQWMFWSWARGWIKHEWPWVTLENSPVEVTCLLQTAPLARPAAAQWLWGSSQLVLSCRVVAATSFGCGEWCYWAGWVLSINEPTYLSCKCCVERLECDIKELVSVLESPAGQLSRKSHSPSKEEGMFLVGLVQGSCQTSHLDIPLFTEKSQHHHLLYVFAGLRECSLVWHLLTRMHFTAFPELERCLEVLVFAALGEGDPTSCLHCMVQTMICSDGHCLCPLEWQVHPRRWARPLHLFPRSLDHISRN